MPLHKSLLNQVRERANYQCEYCHYPEILSTAPLSIDRLLPRSLGGTDKIGNLALAVTCQRSFICKKRSDVINKRLSKRYR